MKHYTLFILLVLGSLLIMSCHPEDDKTMTSSPLLNSTADGFLSNSSGVGDPGFASSENYAEYSENPFLEVADEPISTFSVDADGASYANVRRFLFQDEAIPPKGAVRTEELLNYFELEYPSNQSVHPLSLNGEISSCPWQPGHKLVRIGIKGQQIPDSELKSSNYVFLMDVSGSMSSPDKLELLKKGFNTLVDHLGSTDKVAIVTYAGSSEVVLESTSARQRSRINQAVNSLGAGGGTAGAEGILTAYEIAQENFIQGGNNRIIIGTDGDFNIGVSDRDELVSLIEDKRDNGIFITVLGVGRGNLNDAALEQIANNGNGTYEYIDSEDQLEKVFIHDFHKFYTVAKDVKIQVDFNATNVKEYRLIGYENRVLNNEDFEDDTKDAGEIGSNQNITALYEIIPAQTFRKAVPSVTIDFRYKEPDADNSIPLSLDIYDDGNDFAESTDFQQFVASIASFSMQLTDSSHKGNADYDDVLQWLKNSNLKDPHGFKEEFNDLVKKAKSL